MTLWRLAFVVAVQALCKQSDSSPVRTVLPFCTEHNSRTCCSKATALQLYSRVQKSLGEPVLLHHNESLALYPLSKACLHSTETVYCSACDGDVGEDVLSGICTSLCDQWFESCKNDLFQPGLTSSSIDLCTSRSLVCSPLSLISPSPRDFCSKMGYSPKHDHCYSGTPSALLRGPAPEVRSTTDGSTAYALPLLVGAVTIIALLLLRGKKAKLTKEEVIRARFERMGMVVD